MSRGVEKPLVPGPDDWDPTDPKELGDKIKKDTLEAFDRTAETKREAFLAELGESGESRDEGISQAQIEALSEALGIPQEELEKRISTIEVGGKSGEELISEIERAGMKVGDHAKSILKSPEFVPGEKPEQTTLVRLTVADLGFTKGATLKEIYTKAKELGLELCPPDTGPHLRLQTPEQPLERASFVAMNPIADSHGALSLFLVAHGRGARWLSSDWGSPERLCYPEDEFVFAG